MNVLEHETESDLVTFETFFAASRIDWGKFVADFAAGARMPIAAIEETCKRCHRTTEDLKEAVQRVRDRDANLAKFREAAALRDSLPKLKSLLGEAETEVANEIAKHKERLLALHLKASALFCEYEGARTTADALEHKARTALCDPKAGEDACGALSLVNKATKEQLRIEAKAATYNLAGLRKSVAAKEAELATFHEDNPGGREEDEPRFICDLRNEIAAKIRDIDNASHLMEQAAEFASEARTAAIYYNAMPPGDGLPAELSRAEKIKQFRLTYKGEPLALSTDAQKANPFHNTGRNAIKEGTPDATTEIVAINEDEARAMFNDSRNHWPSAHDARWQIEELPL